ncbi:MAG: class I SAM-dependent methyltransferase [Rhodospirillaceae bacterium]|nr:class I SAM-dependent methyltransferase [Rhodospirillaceae bacterium]
MVSIGETAAYVLSQAGRVGWYYGQYVVSARLSRRSMPRPEISRPSPGRAAMLREMANLMARDLRNVADGIYPLPHDVAPDPFVRLREAADYFGDLPRVNARRRSRRAAEVADDVPDGATGLPAYYLRNFHYQSGGYLTDDSAKRYDHQVEILFGGSADAMRRQVLVPLADFLATRRQSRTRLLDIATGTGRFLTFVLDAFPRLQVTGLDLSAAYLRQARRTVRPFGPARLVQGLAEALPLADASQDVITAIYLFHELPREVREAVAREMARVLAPGGRVILMDSLQQGDRSAFDGLLEYFPQAFHEPYYTDYTQQDLEALFAGCGLRLGGIDLAFMSKVMVFEKP